jgi:hypothetical protein
MEITYELTQEDFTEAFTAHRSRSSAIRWVRIIAFWLVIAFASFVLYGSVRAHNTKSLLPFFFLAILWLVVIWGIIPRWYMRRQFTKQPGAHGPRKLTLDASGAHWRWNGGSAEVEWRNYIRSVEGVNQILFYTSPSCFNILPKRALNPDQLVELRALLAQNIRREK